MRRAYAHTKIKQFKQGQTTYAEAFEVAYRQVTLVKVSIGGTIQDPIAEGYAPLTQEKEAVQPPKQ